MEDDDWKELGRRKDKDQSTHEGKTMKQPLIDRVFCLLEGPIATTFVKLIATCFICATTVALAGVLALAGASTGLLMSMVGLGLTTMAVTWIFGGWKKQTQASNAVQHHAQEVLTLKTKLSELEERLANVEIIERFEDRLAARVVDSSTSAKTIYDSPEINSESTS